MYRRSLFAAGLSATLVLSACGGGNEASFDSDRACRIGARLVEGALQDDSGDVAADVDDLEDLEGVADSDLDVAEIAELADGDLDEETSEDLIAEFDAIDCNLETDAPTTDDTTPSTEGTAPTTGVTTPTTEATTPATEATTPLTEATTPPTEATPPATEPTTPLTEATTPPTESEPEPPSTGGEGIAVDIGASPLPDRYASLELSNVDVSRTLGIEGILTPAGDDSRVYDLSVNVSAGEFPSRGDAVSSLVSTKMKPKQMLAAFRTAVNDLGPEYEFTDSSSSSGDTEVIGFEAELIDFDDKSPRWEVSVGAFTDAKDVYVLRVRQDVAGYTGDTEVPETLLPLLGDAPTAVEAAGATFSGWSYLLTPSLFSDQPPLESVDYNFKFPEARFKKLADAVAEELGGVEGRENESDLVRFTNGDVSWTFYDFGTGTARWEPAR